MKSNQYEWLNVKNGLFLGLGIVLMYLFVTSAIDNRFRDIEVDTRARIAEQESVLIAIAEITARNGADTVTESIVRDCTIAERERFDALLGSLDSGLSNDELTQLERLFGRCGGFYSERKALMTARLVREIEVYEDHVNLLSIVTGADLSSAHSLDRWAALSREEQKQSELFRELVRLQDEIITALLAGSSIESTEMADILYQVREVQGTLVVTNRQASAIRSELVPI